MKYRLFAPLIGTVFLLSAMKFYGQEANYWNLQQGPEATMMGGSFTAGVRDNTAIVYNPGGLGFIDNPSLSVSGDLAYFYVLNMRNGAGEGIGLKEFSGDIASMVFSGIIVMGKNGRVRINYGGFGKEYSHLRVMTQHETFVKIPDTLSGEKLYFGDFDYRHRIKEDWYGIGWGMTITTNLSAGISMMLAQRSQYYGRNFKAALAEVDSTGSSAMPVSYSAFSDDLQYSNYSFLWIAGVNYQAGNWKLGLTITTPRVNQTIVGRGTLNRCEVYTPPGEDSTGFLYATFQQSVKTRYHSPWIIDLGVEYSFPKTVIATRFSYYSRVKPYNMLFARQPQTLSEEITLPPDDPGFINIQAASRQIVNVGIGFRQTLSNTFTLLAGFRTDFNYFDDKTLDRQQAHYSVMSFWNLYHLSGGIIWKFEKLQVNLGFDYGMGFSKGDDQLVNLTNPTLQNYLKGTLGDNTRTIYHQLSGIMGMTYLF